MNLVHRYARLYLYFVRFAVSRSLEFRVDFYFRIFMDLMFYVVNIGFFQVIYLHTPQIAGWNVEQMMVMVGAYLLVDAIQMTLSANGMHSLPITINRGDLDYHLLRPASPIFFVVYKDFAVSSAINLLMAVGILAWALLNYSGPITFLSLTLFLVLLLMGYSLHFMIRMLFIIPVFWTHSGNGLQQLFYTLTRFMERPDALFKGWARGILTTVLPFLLVASFPCRFLFDPSRWDVVMHMFLVTGALALIVRYFWGRGLMAYSSASS